MAREIVKTHDALILELLAPRTAQDIKKLADNAYGDVEPEPTITPERTVRWTQAELAAITPTNKQ